MSNIVVLGAGLNGLATAMLLARDGHEVTILERDPAEPRGDNDALWASWERRGVNQFNQLHFMLARWTATMTSELPDVIEELEGRGATRLNLVHMLPSQINGGVRPGDERFETVTARRPVLEAALAAVAARTSGVTVRRGVQVSSLLTTPGVGRVVPHVVGVRTASGETIPADLVVDASGRRSSIPNMLEESGGRRPLEHREDSGFIYYGRHYRSRDGHMPQPQALLLQHLHGFSLLMLPADNGTWGVGFVTSSRDHALRGLRDEAAWSRATSLVPAATPWCEGDPITGVQVIAGIEDRYRRYVVDGQPRATGLVAVGDAWACTNPSLGRGASIGLMHAVALRRVLREVGPDEPEVLVHRFDEVTEADIAPWYRATLAFDRHRLAEIDGDISGVPYRTADPSWAMGNAIYAAARRDPDVLRVQAALASVLALPTQVLQKPGLLEKVITLGANAIRYPEAAPLHSDLVAAVRGEPGGTAPVHAAGPPKARAAEVPTSSSPRGDGMHVLEGISMFAQDQGTGPAVLLVHGWPDTHALWRRQVRALNDSGYRTIAPDLRGFGASDKPSETNAYGLLHVVADLLELLNTLDVQQVHVVGHDWGGAIGSVLAAMAPGRVASLTCLSVGHPAAFRNAGWEQREKSWYQLLFQFAGVAEMWLSQDDFANLRAWSGHPQIEDVVARLRDPQALTASLGLYRAILPPETLLAPPPDLPPIRVPVLGVWGSEDIAVTERAITGMEQYAVGGWRYERIEGAGHWMQLDQPRRINRLLIDFLGERTVSSLSRSA